MPSGSYIQSDVICPFYKYDDGKKTIVCEGVTGGSTLSARYVNHNSQVQQMRLFCCRGYESCEIYRMVMQAKYGG